MTSTPETLTSSSSQQAVSISSSSRSAATPQTISSTEPTAAMAAVIEEDVRSETIQHIASEEEDNLELLEAEEEAARRAAEAAEARVRLLRARTSSSRTSSRSVASATSRRASTSDISSERIAPPPRVEVITPPPIPEEMHPGNANTEQVMVTTATTHPQLPLTDADTAGTGGAHLGAHDPEVPSQLTELYLRAREQVGDMSAARRFWRAREELRVQEQPARSDHGEGVWTPEARTPAGSDVENRVKELEARMKALADVAKGRMSPAGQPAHSPLQDPSRRSAYQRATVPLWAWRRAA